MDSTFEPFASVFGVQPLNFFKFTERYGVRMALSLDGRILLTEVKTKDGQTITELVAASLGEAEIPMTLDEVITAIDKCSSPSSAVRPGVCNGCCGSGQVISNFSGVEQSCLSCKGSGRTGM